MVHEDNVLTPEGMAKLLALHKRMGNVEYNGSRYRDLCLDIPITDILGCACFCDIVRSHITHLLLTVEATMLVNGAQLARKIFYYTASIRLAGLGKLHLESNGVTVTTLMHIQGARNF